MDRRDVLTWERPTEVRARRTVDALEEALHRNLTERRLADITVSDLCREAGVHRTTFYGHFASVQDLVRAVYVDRLRAAVDQAMAADLPTDLPAEDAVLLRHEFVVEAVLDGLTHRREETSSMFGPDGDLGVQQLVIDVVREACSTAVTEWIRRGVEVPVPPDAAGTMFAYAFLGQVHRWMESGLGDTSVVTAELGQFLPAWWPRRAELLAL
jgi:AcrR family transcriptional regulator